MNKSNELFELCKQVYEAVKWKGVGRKYINKPTEKDEWIPLYTSDYLLEKLPKFIDDDRRITVQPIDNGKWDASYDLIDNVDDSIYDSFGDTPLKALLKLTLKLHEEEIL